VADAVNNPALDIEPHEAAQLTGMLAVNCCVEYSFVVVLDGIIVIGEATVTAADTAPPTAVGVAVTVHGSTTRGAVYNPAVVTDPQLADHVAPAFAMNCCVAPSLTVALVGDTANKGAEIWS
jgi:hypothetical protein